MGVWKKQKTFRITRDLMRLLQKEHLLIFQSTLPDPRSRAPVTAIARFQSTLPERGETLLPFSPARRGEVFQSTLPAWGETGAGWRSPRWKTNFNPLSPHGERRGNSPSDVWQSDFNPLSPHGERPIFTAGGTATNHNFNPLSPHGERPARSPFSPPACYFNPLSPHGERLSAYDSATVIIPFQSTLPAWGETGRVSGG